jgi:hypothetical protein
MQSVKEMVVKASKVGRQQSCGGIYFYLEMLERGNRFVWWTPNEFELRNGRIASTIYC